MSASGPRAEDVARTTTLPARDPVEVPTPHGPARITVHAAAEPRAVLLLGHGAGGGIGAPDLLGATRAALDAEVSVALVEQPYRVAGRRAPAPAAQLDAAWLAVVEHEIGRASCRERV